MAVLVSNKTLYIIILGTLRDSAPVIHAIGEIHESYYSNPVQWKVFTAVNLSGQQ
ncbi:MAG: hypothetical protein RLZ75_2618 [Pseudomonadota bacterium]|jgi:hypothetical protein